MLLRDHLAPSQAGASEGWWCCLRPPGPEHRGLIRRRFWINPLCCFSRVEQKRIYCWVYFWVSFWFMSLSFYKEAKRVLSPLFRQF